VYRYELLRLNGRWRTRLWKGGGGYLEEGADHTTSLCGMESRWGVSVSKEPMHKTTSHNSNPDMRLPTPAAAFGYCC
jgi:hypothetical protein